MAKSPKPRTEFEDLFEQLVEVERELLAAGPRPKLTPKAFVAAAIRNAQTDNARLDALERRLSDPSIGGELGYFIRRLAHDLCESEFYSAPPTDGGRLARVFGTDQTQAILAQAQASALEALALAARIAADRRPERFGRIDDMDEYRRREAELRTNRARLIEALRAADITTAVMIDTEIARADRDRGLARIRFRMNPDVWMTDDWVETLLAAVIAPPEPVVEPPPRPRPMTPQPVDEFYA